MPMKKLLVSAVCFSQLACTTPIRMSADELSTYQINCDKREEQYRFLESQKYTNDQRLMAALQMTSIIGIISNAYNGTGNDSSAAVNMEHEAMIKAQQRQLRQRCLLEDHVNETNKRQKKFVEQREQSLR
jgi:hypothetical protein